MRNAPASSLPLRMMFWTILVMAILSIPYIAHLPWSIGDYVFGSVILLGGATVFEVSTVNMKNPQFKLLVGVVVLLGILTVWGLAAMG